MVINQSVITYQWKEFVKYIQKVNYKNLETPRELFKRLGFLYPETKKEYVLSNGIIIKNRRQVVKSVNKCEKVLAFDTETYQGYCKLLACSGGKNLLNPTFEQCIKFLFYLANNSNVYRFFYNLDFDITSMLKLWISKIPIVNNLILKKIKWLKEGIEVSYKDYKLSWIKGRMFIIKHKKRKKRVVFTDIFNFFQAGLNKSSEKYLKDIKINDMDGNLLNTSLEYWKERERDIIDYCIQDCKLTKKLGVLLINTVEKCELPLPKYLVSSASLSKQNFRFKSYIPRLSNIPEKIIQIGYDTYFGGRFEMFKRGSFNNLYLYDINSQYPSFIRNLPSLRDGVWSKTKKLPKKQCLGYFLAEVKIPKEYKIPTIPINHNGINKFPVGNIKKWLTWYDLDLIRKYIINIEKGYVFLESAICKTNKINERKIFKKEIDLLYNKKKKLKGKPELELEYNLTKLTMNALYGCFIETHKNYDKKGNFTLKGGIMFNSVYASQITAFGRWSVIKDIPKKIYNHIIAIHTDSIISDIPLDKYLKLDDKIGNWNIESNYTSKGIMLNTGMYQIGHLVKTRGIPKKYIGTRERKIIENSKYLKGNWLRFSLKNQSYEKKTFEIPHMRKLSEGLIRDKCLDNVNTMVKDTRSVNCNSDSKRDWIKDFSNFREVLTSNIDSYPYVCYNDMTELHPNALCMAIRYENQN